MFEWHKKEKPFLGMAGMGGGVVSKLTGGGPITVTGGTTFINGSETYHLFISPGPFSVQGGSLSATVFLVAGGGGGVDGGGGAGGIRDVPGFSISGDYNVEVGDGAGPSGGPANSATLRSNWSSPNIQPNPIVGKHTNFYANGTSFPSPSYLRALGGGRGGVWASDGGPGGSGGGGGNRGSVNGGAANTENTTPYPQPNQYGYAGGGSGGQPVDDIGGGGGGAGGGGTTGSASTPTPTRGNGGPGQSFPAYAAPIVGPQLTAAGVPAPEVSAFNSAVGPAGMYGGGGGGGGRLEGDFTGTFGGDGGGGDGGSGAGSGTAGASGVKYTGSGGGGGGFHAPSGTYGPGGAGGKGLVIIRYTTL